MTTSTDKPAYCVISDTEEADVTHLIMKLYSFVAAGNRGKSGEPLPAWDQCGEREYEFVFARTLSAISKKRSADAARILAKAKIGVEAAINAARDTEAVAAAEWDNLSPTLKARFPYTAPKNVRVPVSDILPSFPKGTTVPQAAKMLSDVGYVINVPTLPMAPGAKGRPASNPAGAYIVADRLAASTVADGSTLPHGNGERVELSQGQALAAAK